MIANLLICEKRFKNNLTTFDQLDCEVFFVDQIEEEFILSKIKNNCRISLIGEFLGELFIKITRKKGVVSSFIFSICDAIETPQFSDINLAFFDLAELSSFKLTQLLNVFLVQPKRQADNYHDQYVSELYSRGVSDEKSFSFN